MTADVIVTKTESGWAFEPVTPEARAQFHGHIFKPETIEEAQKLVFVCSSWGLFVQAPAFTTYYQTPTLRQVKTEFKSKRHPIIGRKL